MLKSYARMFRGKGRDKPRLHSPGGKGYGHLQQEVANGHFQQKAAATTPHNNNGSESPESDMEVDCCSTPGTPNTLEKPIALGPSEKPHASTDDFDFLKVIGKGSFGKVLQARHRKQGKVSVDCFTVNDASCNVTT